MTDEQQKKLDADVLATLDILEKTIWADGNWVPEWRFYKALSQYSHKEIDEACTRLEGKIEISYRMYDKIEFYYRLTPAGRKTEK